MERAGIQIREV